MPQSSSLRWIVFALAGLHTLALIGLLLIFNVPGSSDPLGRSIAIGVSIILTVPWALTALPALILAFRNRAPRIALGLTVAGYVISFYFWYTA
jgi:hypothetical protein